jgi:hypothetical protein
LGMLSLIFSLNIDFWLNFKLIFSLNLDFWLTFLWELADFESHFDSWLDVRLVTGESLIFSLNLDFWLTFF